MQLMPSWAPEQSGILFCRWRIGAEPHAGNGVEKSRSASSSMGFGLRLRFLAGMKKEIARVKNRTIKGELHGCCAKPKIN
jgi:hypothetical protein